MAFGANIGEVCGCGVLGLAEVLAASKGENSFSDADIITIVVCVHLDVTGGCLGVVLGVADGIAIDFGLTDDYGAIHI